MRLLFLKYLNQRDPITPLHNVESFDLKPFPYINERGKCASSHLFQVVGEAVSGKMSFIADFFDKYEYKNGSVVDKVGKTFSGHRRRKFICHSFQVPQDMLHLIDPHWYAFRPINPLWQVILGITISILAL